MLGALVGPYTIDRFGRKFNIMMCSVPFVCGWTMVAGAKAVSVFYLGRFIVGLGLGAISLTVPVSAKLNVGCYETKNSKTIFVKFG